MTTVEPTPGGAAVTTPPPEGTRDRLGVVLTTVLSISAPPTVVTALLFYIGYVSARSYYSYFGISLSALDHSTTDFVTRSPNVWLRPVVVLLLGAMALFVVHRLMAGLLLIATQTTIRRVVISLSVGGVLLSLIGWFGLSVGIFGVWGPLVLAAAVLTFEYAATLASRRLALGEVASAALGQNVDLRRGLVAALVLLILFWVASGMAQARGQAEATLVEAALPVLPQAVVYSEEDLRLQEGRGVGVTLLSGEEGDFRFRYNGLRPLVRSDGRWFLLPVDWQRDNGTTVVVLDDDPGRLRVDLSPAALGTPDR